MKFDQPQGGTIMKIKIRTTIIAIVAAFSFAATMVPAAQAAVNTGDQLIGGTETTKAKAPDTQRPVRPGTGTHGPLGRPAQTEMPKDAGSAGQPGYGDTECAMLLGAWRSARQKWLDAAVGSAAESYWYGVMSKIWRALNDHCMIVMD